MRLDRILVLSLALLPPLAWSAPDAPRAPEPSSVPPPLVTAPDEPETEEAPAPRRFHRFHAEPAPLPVRLAGETVGAALGGSAGVALGFLGGGMLSTAVSCGFDDCRTGRIITYGTSALGLGFGAATGVYLAGSLMDARGQYLPTLLGGLMGGGASMALLSVTEWEADNAPLIAGYFVLPVVGSILGYELSTPSAPASGAALSRRGGPTFLPTVALTPEGGALGLAGRF